MHEHKSDFAREILKSFAESSGDGFVFIESLVRKGMVDQLPSILKDQQVVDELAAGYASRHRDHNPQAIGESIGADNRKNDIYANLTTGGVVLAIIVSNLRDYSGEKKFQQIADTIEGMLADHKQ